jgi:hypothetical protein
MTRSRAERAARNNAIWCDTVCRAHGVPGEFHDTLWVNRHAVPRFHPNSVMLADGRSAREQLAHIRQLVAADLARPWSVKDSFSALDLAELTFQPLFDATWLWRAPSAPLPGVPPVATRWARIDGASELAAWEAAWSRDPTNRHSAPSPRLFLPSLVADREVAFIAAYAGPEIVAGAIANRGDGVVGVSNLFAPRDALVPFWAGCVARIHECFPGLPLVGYERAAELAAALAVGFEALHDLRVWVRPAP